MEFCIRPFRIHWPASKKGDDLVTQATELHSIRLFPKGHGAPGYVLTGIAARCDWVLLSDQKEPTTSLIRQCQGQPATVFVSLRQPFAAIEVFYNQVLPQIKSRFVLVTGSEDVTVPIQLDHRWRRFDEHEREMLERIRIDARVVAWFAENLDTTASKMVPLPTGLLPPSASGANESSFSSMQEHASRPLGVLCCHRVRAGGQWNIRRGITATCLADQSGLCHVIEEELDLDVFVETLRQHAFVICAEGGGLDPSPKAWMAMLNGAIPIVRRTSTTAAYQGLPVAFVDDWSQPFLDRKWLEAERNRLAPMFDDDVKRIALQEKLGLDYWWRRIKSFSGENKGIEFTKDHLQSSLFVVGMHRSGTSLLTALLVCCGANAGPEHELTRPNQHNPKGFWENNVFRDINDKLLRGQSCEWDCPLEFDFAGSAPELVSDLSGQARQLLDSYQGSQISVFKDPRICLVLEFWRGKIPDLVPLLIFRNPVEVALSLFRRNRIPLPIGIALWELYMLSAVRQSIDLDPLIVNHQDLIYQPLAVLDQLVTAVNQRCGQVLQMPDRNEIERFVDLKLHRETAFEDDIRQYLVEEQQTFWALLQDRKLDLISARKLSGASRLALQGYRELGMQFSRVRHLEDLDPNKGPR